MLASCSNQSQQVEEPSPSPSASIALPSLSPSATPAASPTSNLQTYREKSKGLFEISFPKGYSHKMTASGVAFVSADQGFAGAVDFSSAEGKQLTTQQLETALKTEFTNRLQSVSWQNSQVQADGSLRLDWTGKDKTGSNLDAVSIVEQRGNYIFVLNLFGVNKAYQNYNADAETIVNHYKIQPSGSPRPSPSASPKASPKPKS